MKTYVETVCTEITRYQFNTIELIGISIGLIIFIIFLIYSFQYMVSCCSN